MWNDAGTISFSTPAEFGDALSSVRRALTARGLSILAESDIAGRLKQSLGIRLQRCRVLYVWPQLMPAKELYPASAMILPLHVVVAEHIDQTEICVVSQLRGASSNGADLMRSAIVITLTEILLSLDTMSMRPSLV